MHFKFNVFNGYALLFTMFNTKRYLFSSFKLSCFPFPEHDAEVCLIDVPDWAGDPYITKDEFLNIEQQCAEGFFKQGSHLKKVFIWYYPLIEHQC